MIRKKSIGINAVLNIVKQVSSMIFPLITIPYVSRILQVENYGKVTYSSSIISYFNLIASLGISSYAIREGARLRNNKKQLNDLENEIFTINMCSTLVAYLLLFALIFTNKGLANYRILLVIQSVGMLFTTLGADWINSIHEDYFYITIRYIFVQISSLVLLLLLVHNSEDYIIYAAISIFATAGANIFNIIYIRKHYAKLKLVASVKCFRHLKPIFLLFFSYIAMTIYVNSDTTMLGIFENDMAVGIYGVATKIYLAVKQMLNAIVTVTIPQASLYIAYNEKKYYEIIKKILNILIALVIPCIIGLFWVSKNVILLISGYSYLKAYEPLMILTIALLPAVIAYFFSSCVLLPRKMEKEIMVASIVSAVVNIGLNFIAIPFLSYNGAALTTLCSEYTVLIVMYFYGKKYIKDIVSKKDIFPVIIGCIIISICCVISSKVIEGNIIQLIFSIISSIIGYTIVLILFKHKLIIELKKQIINRVKS